MVCTERFSESVMHRLFFNTDLQLIPFIDYRYPAIPVGENFPRPDSLSKMFSYLRALSQDAAFVTIFIQLRYHPTQC